MKFRDFAFLALLAATPLVAQPVSPVTPTPATLPAAATLPGRLPAGCCGAGRMMVEGDVYLWEGPEDGLLPDGTTIPPGDRVECFGNVIVAKADLPAGVYTIEVEASENSFTRPGQRVFNIKTVDGSGKESAFATDVDLLQAAGAPGKPVILKSRINHPGGLLKLVFTGKVDRAKFSAIRILAADGPNAGAKVAWLFAEDLADFLRLPGEPPVISGPIVWRDAAAPLDKRVADLVRRMTLREKIWQLSNQAPPIERLGIPGYNYWSEALHGVARNGIATVFPQAIGMAASFDPPLLQQVADTISTEGRAKFNAWRTTTTQPAAGTGFYQGLTFWSPNINIFRDPRWGRGQETYGEDPLLTGRMAVAFIRGLQGDDPRYLKVAATAKHFAVHSGPESLRHVFDARPPQRDFYETYLPQFEMAVRDARVASVMGAYNRVYGDPACDSDLLLKQLLRRTWGFQGYVVSDCEAITDIWANHQAAANEAEASADAVRAGCDLECGSNYTSLAAAVDMNLIGEGAIDTALSRVLESRFRLGLFDPPELVRYARIPPEESDTPAHDALALQMARESMVLLKNDGILPLDPARIRKLALVGPNGDGLLGLLGNYNGTPSRPSTIVEGLRSVFGDRLTFIRGYDSAPRLGDWQMLPDLCLRPPATGGVPSSESGLKAEWFNNGEAQGRPAVTRTEKSVDFHGRVEWIAPGIGSSRDTQSVRWSGSFVAPADGDYRLGVGGLSPFRLWVNGRQLINVWENGTGDPRSLPIFPVRLKAGESIDLVLEARILLGTLDLQLAWDEGAGDRQGPRVDLSGMLADRVKDADAIVFAGGLDGHMEAEENDLRGLFQGFDNGDRTAIELPDTQLRELRALIATGKPVIFVNLTGSAVALPFENATDNRGVRAILQAWYPGQAGGRAVAEVLTGRYNPAGRLPITFYRGTADLPPFDDYSMGPHGPDAPPTATTVPATQSSQAATRRTAIGTASPGRTYRYFTGIPQWPFGFGLSYSRFDYANMQLSATQTHPGDTVQVTLQVRNSSTRDGEEVVQLYARNTQPLSGDPLKTLVGFQRIKVPANSTVPVSIAIPMALLRTWDANRQQYVVRSGNYALEAGASSADIRISRQLNLK